ncbi:MAG: DUF1800 family protein [Ilumatobacteraceae bacterium]
MAEQAQIEHLLRRTEFVARPARVAALMALSLEAAIDDILAVSAPPALPTYIDHNNDRDLDPAAPSNWDQYVYSLKWWFDRMAFDSPKPIQEKMTLFWHGHFTSDWWKVYDTWAMTSQNQLYRVNALGNFQTLAQQMAIEPAMLRYLDNADNTKSSPNQNFARELMELFLLGVGNYTEADVEASSAAWTGHTLDDDGHYWFRTDRHNNLSKTFFAVTGNLNGPDIINIILDKKKQIAARYIVGKLWDFFAAPGTQPNDGLDAIATTFASNWDIKVALKAILLLPEFYTDPVKQGLIRSPIDWVVAVMVQTGYRAGLLNPQWYVEGMGQVPFSPPNVSGWRPNGAWINTSSMGSRAEFARNATWRLRDAQLAQNAGRGDMGNLWTLPVDQAVDTVAALFALNPMSVRTRTALSDYANGERTLLPKADRNGWWMATNLLTMAMIAPEMHLA